MKYSDFIFIPVSVSRGRKFRGKAYDFGQQPSANDYGRFVSVSMQLWCPSEKKFVYANPDFVKRDDSISDEQIATDKEAFERHIVDTTYDFCRSKTTIEEDAQLFARSLLRKYYPFSDVNLHFADIRSAALELEKTLQWALNLKTRSTVNYWKFWKVCPGGKPLLMKKKLHIAHTAIINRGIDKLECFNEALELECILFGIGKDQLMNS